MAVREIIHRLKLSGEEFSRSYRAQMDEVRTESQKAGEDAGERFAGGFRLKHAAIAAAAGAAGTAVANAINRSLDLATDLDKTSKELGVGVERLQEWRYAAQQSGIAANDLDTNLGKLTQRIGQANEGNRAAQQSFVDVGIGFQTMGGAARSTEAVFMDVIQRLHDVEDPAKRAALGSALLGDNFATMEPLIRGGADGVRAATAEIHSLNGVLSSEQIRELHVTNAKLEQMKAVLSVRIAGIVAENTGAIIALGDGLGYVAQKAADAVTWYQKWTLTRGLRQAENVRDGWFTSDKDSAEAEKLAARYRRALAGMNDDKPNVLRAPGASQLPDWMTGTASVPPVVSPATLRRSGGGGSRPRGGSQGPSEAEREAERQAKEAVRNEEAFADAVRKTIQAQEDSAWIESVRGEAGEAASAGEAARLALIRQIPELEHKTVEELGKALGYTEKIIEARRTELQMRIDQGDVAESEAAARASEAKRQQLDKARIDKMEREYERAFSNLAGMWEDLFTGGTDRIWGNFKRQGMTIISEIAAEYTLALLSGQGTPDFNTVTSGALGRSPIGSIFGAGRTLFGTPANDNGGGITVTRGGGFNFGGAGIVAGDQPRPEMVGASGGLAGAVSSVMGPLALASAANSLIGDIFGFEGGPLGILTGLFTSTKRGSAIVGGNAGQLGIQGFYGNSGSRKDAAAGGANSLIGMIEQIADALGGDINSSVGAVSLGMREGNWRVDSQGRGYTKLSGNPDVRDFGADQEGAIRYAVSVMLERGVVDGITDASKKILASGQDLEKAIEKAVLIESVPDLLRQRLDPLGYALDEVYKKFVDLADALHEGGANAEQLAQAKQLWELERDEVIARTGGGSDTLQGFRSSLMIGSDSPLSLREQQAAAESAFAPFQSQISTAQAARAEVDRLKASGASAAEIATAEEAARVAAYKIDQSGFQTSAQNYLGLSRQINASGGSFFGDFNRINNLTGTAIGLIDAAGTRPTETRDPFTEATAKNTGDIVNMSADQTALLKQVADGITALNDNFAHMSPNWLGQARGYAS